MHDQPKYRPLRASAFFENTSSARPLVEGTIARGTLQTDTAFFTGKNGAMLVTELPFPVTQAVLDRGQERYNIYCTPCHDATGSGNGLVVQRGFPKPQTYHSDRLRQMEAGLLLRRHDERFRPDAGLPRADHAARSLEHRRLHPRAAAEPARGDGGRPGRRPDQDRKAGGHRARTGEALTHL